MADVAMDESPKLESKFTDLELEHPVEGDITIPGAIQDEDLELSTLDEPVKETVMRDLRAVGIKFFHVLYPKQSKTLLKEWDLWGPGVLCTILAILLQDNTDKDSSHTEFSEVFALISFGAIIVALNSKLLGGVISFFQSVCVLGYCILPMVISMILARIILAFDTNPKLHSALFAVRLIIVIIAFGWSTFASLAFIGESQPQHRKLLAIYPVFLFYFVIGWMIISRTGSV
ncbi:protein YIPF6-like isoform X2 [Amphiura filiformis]|uniref:protein YIPF6-like isoform X2 n=1 Tax=Amphiura filiformis TaxID=82378 RepID=UPI003B2108A7